MSPGALRVVAAAALLLSLHGEVKTCSNVTSLSQQLDTALASYDRENAPARPTRISLLFDLHHATVRADRVHMLGDLVMSWQDPRITWNATDWGCDSVLASADRLWLPDVALLNGAGWAGGAEGAEGAGGAVNVRLRSDGRASWVARLDAAVPAPLEITRWPKDRLTAVFKFGSRTHNEGEMLMGVVEARKVIFESGPWEMISTTNYLIGAVDEDADEDEEVTNGSEAVGRVAVWKVVLQRRAPAQVAAARAVFAAVELMLIAAAALAPGTRAPLCACASFTAALWLVTALLQLPAGGGAQPPAALQAMCALCAAGAAAGAAAALVARVARCSRQPPRPLRTLASSFSKMYPLSLNEESCNAEVAAWAALAQLLDLVLVGALLLVLLVSACFFV